LPEAPDIRPSVTSATAARDPAALTMVGVSEWSSGIPLACGPWKRTTTIVSEVNSPALKAALTAS
jgi:hypothetical protein